MIDSVADAEAHPTRGRAESRESLELRALKDAQPDLAHAVDMHLELLDVQRRVQGRIPLPSFDFNSKVLAYHQAEGVPLLRFEDIPLDLTDLRLIVRQTADILRRYGTLDEGEFQKAQAIGRDLELVARIGAWYRATAERRAGASVGAGPGNISHSAAGVEVSDTENSTMDQLFTVAMRPFLSRCAEPLQRHPELSIWRHHYCPLCGGEPDLAVITPAAERHLICGRCTLHWNFEPLTCPYCRNSDRSRITSFATPDGQYRVYACDACSRYLKAYDGRRTKRPVMPVVDNIATMPLDAAAMQRGYTN